VRDAEDGMPKRTGRYPTRYPFREIAASGNVAVLTAGDDFEGDEHKVRAAAYSWARRHGYRVVTRINGERGEFFVQFVRA
jgi:hypothetical protein